MMNTMRFSPVALLVLVLAGCAPSTPPPPVAEPLPSPSSPSPSTSAPASPTETPTGSTDDLPDIWPEMAALWANLPADTRDNYCSQLEGASTTETTVFAWQVFYQEATSEEASSEDVRAVLQWLCGSNQ